MSTLLHALIAMDLENRVEPRIKEHVRPAFAGDVQAAFDLNCALDNVQRGEVSVAMWRAKIPIDAFRVFLAATWEHDHQHVIRAAETRRRLAAMFRYAAFPSPDHITDRLAVWRGTSHLSPAEAAKGYSWTTERDIACWFAMRGAKSGGTPLVLAADISKRDVALFHYGRSEFEVVLMKPPAHVVVDGNSKEWMKRFQLHESVMRRERLEELARARERRE